MNARLCSPASGTARGCVRALLGDQDGAIGVEYGLLVALIALTILGTIQALGINLGGLPLLAIVNALS
jgi:Flp pilus assembly pilin Flp